MKLRLRQNKSFPKLNEAKIKKLLQEVIEDEDDSLKKQTGAPKINVPIHKPKFPMDFILFKFPKLKVVLNELLTVTFRDYIDNIYVVAPKPTTLKIVLKNKQYFFLTYDERSYIVKSAGKKFYLLNLGEKERAIKSIANLLATKKFTTAKDIEGDEDSSSSSESKGGGSSGGGNFPGAELDSNTDSKGEDLPELPPDLTGAGEDTPGDEDEVPSEDIPELKENITLRINLRERK